MSSSATVDPTPVKPQIVVAGDDEEARDLLVQQAIELGFAVRTTSSSEDLFWLLRLHVPDLIVLDLRLADADLIQVVRKLAGLRLLPRPVIVVLAGESGMLVDLVRQLARTGGLHVAGSLGKPLSPQAMRTLLDSVREQLPFKGDYRDQHLAEQLALGIPNDELVLHYQPKVRISDRSIEGVEALVRWNHPVHGLLSPDRFIQLAENSGAIVPLTWVVLRNAVRQHGIWRQAGLTLPMSVNVSTSFLRSPDAADVILRLLQTEQCDPSQITLELTETEVAANRKVALEILSRLRLYGIRVAMDDYGVAFSDLARLRRYPFTDLKIDRALVIGLAEGKSGRMAMRKVMKVSRDLGLATTGEGVETEEQWRRLRKEGCEVAQGFLISRPLPASQLLKWAEDWSAVHPAAAD